jgi:hypothetical protein
MAEKWLGGSVCSRDGFVWSVFVWNSMYRERKANLKSGGAPTVGSAKRGETIPRRVGWRKISCAT